MCTSLTRPIANTYHQIQTWVYVDTTKKKTAQVVMIVLFIYGSQRLYKKKRVQAVIGYAGGTVLWVNKDLFDLKTLKQQNETLSREIEVLKQLNTGGKQTLADLQKEVENFEAVREMLQQENKRLEGSNASLQSTSATLQNNANKLQGMLDQLLRSPPL